MTDRLLHVLLVEDSEDDAVLLLRELERGDYALKFKRVDTAVEMQAALEQESWDLVISDYNMPHFNALDALRLLQESHLDLPFIIVSGSIGEDTAVKAMKAGAHDFILKGNLARLVPAVERELREASIRWGRKRDREQIEASLKEKEVLLKEIHHRVKNNLQIICSLLNLQSRFIKDRSVLNIFKESQNRIYSMALIHEKLYQSKDLSNIDFAEYVCDLGANLFHSHGINSNNIRLKTEIANNILLNVDTALNCGLIIHELISNSLKYAFTQSETGEIYVMIQSANDRKITIIVRDNGIGLPPNFKLENTKTLGLILVNKLVEQLKGNIELNINQGTEFKITFTNFKLGEFHETP